ncbi:hypothetical protein D3C72_2017560 [compost metagenome]
MGDVVEGDRLAAQFADRLDHPVAGFAAANAAQVEGHQAEADDRVAAAVQAGGLDIQGQQRHLFQGGVGAYRAGLVEARQARVAGALRQLGEKCRPVGWRASAQASHSGRFCSCPG